MENLSFPEIRAEVAEYNDEAILLEGFDEAIVGVVEVFGRAPVVCYDRGRCLEIIEETCGGNSQKAEEHLAFNIIGNALGDNTPVFLTRFGMND